MKKSDKKDASLLTVTKTVQGETSDTSEEIQVHNFATAAATVEVGVGITLNLGNYETARLDVRVSRPCYREEIDAAFKATQQYVEEQIKTQITEIRKTVLNSRKQSF